VRRNGLYSPSGDIFRIVPGYFRDLVQKAVIATHKILPPKTKVEAQIGGMACIAVLRQTRHEGRRRFIWLNWETKALA
jgi:hypothetical protein